MVKINIYRGLPGAQPDSHGIGDLVQTIFEHRFDGVGAIELHPAQLQFPDIGYLPWLKIEIGKGLLLPEFIALEFLAGGISVACTDARAKAIRIAPPVGGKIEIQHQGNGEIVHRQLILCVIDRVDNDGCGVDPVPEILLVAVVIQLDAETPFQVDDVFDQAESLHKEPDIDVYGFPVIQVEPIAGRAGSEFLRSGG